MWGGFEGDIPAGIEYDVNILLVVSRHPYIVKFDPVIYSKELKKVHSDPKSDPSYFDHMDASNAATFKFYHFIPK